MILFSRFFLSTSWIGGFVLIALFMGVAAGVFTNRAAWAQQNQNDRPKGLQVRPYNPNSQPDEDSVRRFKKTVPMPIEVLAAEQKIRMKFIQEAIHQNIFVKFSSEIPRCELWVGSRFLRLRRKQQRDAASVAWSFCRSLSHRAHTLLLRNGATDKQIGTFTRKGLKLF